jgi:hypothetical protein
MVVEEKGIRGNLPSRFQRSIVRAANQDGHAEQQNEESPAGSSRTQESVETLAEPALEAELATLPTARGRGKRRSGQMYQEAVKKKRDEDIGESDGDAKKSHGQSRPKISGHVCSRCNTFFRTLSAESLQSLCDKCILESTLSHHPKAPLAKPAKRRRAGRKPHQLMNGDDFSKSNVKSLQDMCIGVSKIELCFR